MKSILLLACLLVAVIPSEGKSSNFVIGGRDATIEEFPYMAGVRNLGITSCGGSIINSRTVLTAAHCILINVPGAISVSVGSSRRRGQGGTTHRSLRAIIHPEYVFESSPVFRMEADVALVRTIRDIQFGPRVQPIALGFDFVPAGAQVLLTGWGLLGQSSIRDRADQMQQLEMVSIPNLLCATLHRGTEAEGSVSSEKLCVIASANRGGCSGDSGGPVTLNGVVVGIASWTVRPCGSYPTVFIRVAHYAHWIGRNS